MGPSANSSFTPASQVITNSTCPSTPHLQGGVNWDKLDRLSESVYNLYNIKGNKSDTIVDGMIQCKEGNQVCMRVHQLCYACIPTRNKYAHALK